MNPITKTALALLSLAMLSGCAERRMHRAEQVFPVSSNDDKGCLSSSPLIALKVPPGISLPPENSSYLIPAKPMTNKQVKHHRLVDIRPPIQPLALLPGSRAYYQDERAHLQLDNRSNSQSLWQQLNHWLVAQQINTIVLHEDQKMLTTDWISWPDAEEKRPYSARYQLAVQLQDARPTIIVRLIALWQPVPGEVMSEQKPTDPDECRRYTLLMLNRISSALERQRGEQKKPPVALLSSVSGKHHG